MIDQNRTSPRLKAPCQTQCFLVLRSSTSFRSSPRVTASPSRRPLRVSHTVSNGQSRPEASRLNQSLRNQPRSEVPLRLIVTASILRTAKPSRTRIMSIIVSKAGWRCPAPHVPPPGFPHAPSARRAPGASFHQRVPFTCEGAGTDAPPVLVAPVGEVVVAAGSSLREVDTHTSCSRLR